MSKLYFYYGSMGSSKSAQLLMNAHSFEERGVPFICVKPTIDTRDGEDTISSRVGLSRECISVSPEDNFYDVLLKEKERIELMLIGNVRWILVDESQFLTSKQIDQLAEFVDKFDISAICYGLRTDFQSHLFEGF